MSSVEEAFGRLDDAAHLERVLSSLGEGAAAAYRKYARDTGIGAVSLDQARQDILTYGRPLDHSSEIAAVDQAD